jgi:hypothetical protein
MDQAVVQMMRMTRKKRRMMKKKIQRMIQTLPIQMMKSRWDLLEY